MSRFEEKEEIKRAVDSLVSATLAMGPGAVLSWQAIERAGGVERRYYIARRVYRTLRTHHGIVLRAVARQGYRILSDREQVYTPAEDRRSKARRQLHWATKEIGGAKHAKLTVQDRKARAFYLDRLKVEKREIARSLKVVRQQETGPVRPAPKRELVGAGFMVGKQSALPKAKRGRSLADAIEQGEAP